MEVGGGDSGYCGSTFIPPVCFRLAHCKIFCFYGYAHPMRIEFYAVSILACAVGFFHFILVLSSLKGSDRHGGTIMMTHILQARLSSVLWRGGVNQSELPTHCACSCFVHAIGWEPCGMLSSWLEAVLFCESSTTWVELGLAVGIKCWLELFCAETLDNIAIRRPHRGGAKRVVRSIDISRLSCMKDVLLKMQSLVYVDCERTQH
jgi:hypothetical protein